MRIVGALLRLAPRAARDGPIFSLHECAMVIMRLSTKRERMSPGPNLEA